MDTTTILPTPPTSGAIVQSAGYDCGYDCLAELITNNNIAENARHILNAINSSTSDIIADIGVNSVAALNATNQASVANLKATGDANTANLKAIGDSTVAINKNVYDGVVSNMNTTNLTSVATQKAISDSALASALASAEVRELINTTAASNLMATKDSLVALKDDGCKTREILGQKIWDLEKETLKGFANTQLEALKNKCELAAQIAECCCEQKEEAAATRALILSEAQKRLEIDNQNLRTELLIKNCK